MILKNHPVYRGWFCVLMSINTGEIEMVIKK